MFENQSSFNCLDKFPRIGSHMSAYSPDTSKKSHVVTHGASSKLVLATIGDLDCKIGRWSRHVPNPYGKPLTYHLQRDGPASASSRVELIERQFFSMIVIRAH